MRETTSVINLEGGWVKLTIDESGDVRMETNLPAWVAAALLRQAAQMPAVQRPAK
jgi:hypothetical protein